MTIQELLQEIEQVTDLLYQNQLNSGVPAVSQLVQRLITAIPSFSDDDITKCTEILKDVVGAMEFTEYILVADILVYEMYPIVEEYK